MLLKTWKEALVDYNRKSGAMVRNLSGDCWDYTGSDSHSALARHPIDLGRERVTALLPHLTGWSMRGPDFVDIKL